MLLARRITYSWRAGASGELAPDRLSLIRSWHKHGSPPAAAKSLLRVTTPLMAPLLRAGATAKHTIWHETALFCATGLLLNKFDSVCFHSSARRADETLPRVSLCIFRDQASGAALWSPQLNLEPSCFRNSPRNSAACPDFLKHYLRREVGRGAAAAAAVEEEGERDGRDASFWCVFSPFLLFATAAAFFKKKKNISTTTTHAKEKLPRWDGTFAGRTRTHTHTQACCWSTTILWLFCFFFLTYIY